MFFTDIACTLPRHVGSMLRRAFCLCVLLLAVLSVAGEIYAAEKFGNALDWAPADVSFYSSALRMKEQVGIVASSHAWQKFREIPAVVEAWKAAETQMKDAEGPLAIALQMMELPENQQLLQLAGDMFSSEVAVFGGQDAADFIELYQELNGANIVTRLQAAAGDPSAARELRMRAFFETLQESEDLLKTPDFVFAFRLTDQAAAETQLKRLEVLARMALRNSPLAERFKKEQIEGVEYLTLTLDGTQVPWNQFPWELVEQEEGEFDDLQETLAELKLVISLGIRDGYLILATGNSTEVVAKLGKGPTLNGIDELKPLRPYRDRNLVSVSYQSDRFAKQTQMGPADIEVLLTQLPYLLELVEADDDNLTERIDADTQKLAEGLKKIIPEPGSTLSFSLLTPTGYESFAYDGTENFGLDGSKPLPIVNHLGGNPILALASRGKFDGEFYSEMVEWAQIGYGYFEEFGLPQFEEEDRAKVVEGIAIAKPLLARADQTTRQKLLPSLRDSQVGFVLDAKISSQQWHKEMPVNKEALPMAEVALVLGLSDASLFKQAMSEYKAVADDLVKGIRQMDPEAIPAEYQIPAPTLKATEAGDVYTYALPTEAGFDLQIAPSGGVNERVAVFATSLRLASTILRQSPLANQTILESATQKPCARMGDFNWASFVTAATPWIEFAIREHGPGSEDTENIESNAEVTDLLAQVRSGLEIMKCWRTTQSITTLEDGKIVTHTVTVISDLQE